MVRMGKGTTDIDRGSDRKEGRKEGRRSWHSLACSLLRACLSGHPVTVVQLKDSGQAVTCLDCKYRGETQLLEALPKPKLKQHQLYLHVLPLKCENLIGFLRDPSLSSSPPSDHSKQATLYMTLYDFLYEFIRPKDRRRRFALAQTIESKFISILRIWYTRTCIDKSGKTYVDSVKMDRRNAIAEGRWPPEIGEQIAQN